MIKVDYNDNQKLIPSLATEWKSLDDGTLEFKLRKGVKFHDGEEMTAEDVAFSFGSERLFHESFSGCKGLGDLEPQRCVHLAL